MVSLLSLSQFIQEKSEIILTPVVQDQLTRCAHAVEFQIVMLFKHTDRGGDCRLYERMLLVLNYEGGDNDCITGVGRERLGEQLDGESVVWVVQCDRHGRAPRMIAGTP